MLYIQLDEVECVFLRFIAKYCLLTVIQSEECAHFLSISKIFRNHYGQKLFAFSFVFYVVSFFSQFDCRKYEPCSVSQSYSRTVLFHSHAVVQYCFTVTQSYRLDLTWLDLALTWLTSTCLDWTWLDFTWQNLTWLHRAWPDLTWLDLTWLVLSMGNGQ